MKAEEPITIDDFLIILGDIDGIKYINPQSGKEISYNTALSNAKNIVKYHMKRLFDLKDEHE